MSFDPTDIRFVIYLAVIAGIIIRRLAATPPSKRPPRPPASPPPPARPAEPPGASQGGPLPSGLSQEEVRRQLDAQWGTGGRRPVSGGTRAAPGAPPPQQPSQPARAAPPPPPPEPKLALDLGVFAPLTDADAKKTAQSMGSALQATRFQFGFQSQIPPVTDPRTLLIDRALVGHGYITPEELKEIHEVGAAMDVARPARQAAQTQADAAVRRSKEEREAAKQQKKAQSAEKKRLRADAIARRKATDIIFLGRGVSEGLSDRRANVEQLEKAALPVLATPADVAKALGLEVPRLRWLAFHSEAAKRIHYVRFSVPKKSGGTRELSAPHRDLSRCQDWIRVAILQRIPVREPAHGFVRGRSTVTNAAPHAGRRVVVNADLKDFFPSITFPRVRGIFAGLGYSPAVATILALLATEAPRRTVEYAGETLHVATGPRALPQGASTSPALSNLAVRALDARLLALSKKIGWTYTRYADDLTFSSDIAGAKIGYLLARLRHFTEEEGLTVNEKKTRVQRPNRRQTVTGVVVNARPGVPRRLARRLRAILHRAKTEGLAAQNRGGEPNFRAWLHGMIAYVIMVNPEQGRPLKEALDALGEGS